MMRLLPNWAELLRKAWSVRFIAASFACDVIGIVLAVSGALGVQESPWRAIALQVLGAAFSLGAFIARFVFQRGLSREA